MFSEITDTKYHLNKKCIVEINIEGELYVEKEILCIKGTRVSFSFPMKRRRNTKGKNNNNKYNYLDNIHNDILGVEK